MLKKEQELKLHPDGGQFGRLDLPAFHPDQLRGGQSRVDEALGMGRQRGGEGLNEKLEPKLLVARIMELEQYVGRLEQQFEELFQREQEHQHTKELLAIAMEVSEVPRRYRVNRELTRPSHAETPPTRCRPLRPTATPFRLGPELDPPLARSSLSRTAPLSARVRPADGEAVSPRISPRSFLRSHPCESR